MTTADLRRRKLNPPRNQPYRGRKSTMTTPAATTADLRRRALAELGVALRRLPSGGYVARGPGAPAGRRDLIARDERELAEVLRRWLELTT